MTERRTKVKTLSSHLNHHINCFSPSDSSSVVITTIKFDGKNYDLWEQAIRIALKAKNKLGFVDGKITKAKVTISEKDSAMENAWNMVNSMISSWIMNVIDPNLHASIAYVEFVHEICENIKKQHSTPNVLRIHNLKAEIALSKQGNKKFVEFLSKFMSLWNELENSKRALICKYVATEKMVKKVADDKVHQFLMGLDDDAFSTFVVKF